jgi:hypothetical protein
MKSLLLALLLSSAAIADSCIAEPKETIGLSGDSGGPKGEKVGSNRVSKLKITGM